MQEKFVEIKASRHTKIHIYVTNPFRGNFNDEYWLLDRDILLDEIKDKPLEWFDPYFGRSRINDTQIAILSVGDNEFRILKRKTNVDQAQEKKSSLGSITLVEDFDESCLLASHIELR